MTPADLIKAAITFDPEKTMIMPPSPGSWTILPVPA
jgi:hypothetical protein